MDFILTASRSKYSRKFEFVILQYYSHTEVPEICLKYVRWAAFLRGD
jgi:hypothetical protein